MTLRPVRSESGTGTHPVTAGRNLRKLHCRLKPHLETHVEPISVQTQLDKPKTHTE